jgi:hypothetical protein
VLQVHVKEPLVLLQVALLLQLASPVVHSLMSVQFAPPKPMLQPQL